MTTGRTALVLSGGGSLGAVQVGMLQALAGAGFAADMVVGASVGALNGAVYADDPSVAGLVRLAELWRGMRSDEVFPLSWTAGIKALLRHRDHLVEAGALLSLIHRALSIRRIEEARVPLHITATDVLSGEPVLLSSGEVGPALEASTAIPVVFPHVKLGGHYLIDAGVGENTPIAAAVDLGADRIVVLPTGFSCGVQEPPRHMLALALHIVSLHSMRQLDRDVQRFAPQVEIIIVPPLCPLNVSAFDFSQSEVLIARAAKQTSEWLQAGGMDRCGPLSLPLAHRTHHGRAHFHDGIAACKDEPMP